MNNVERKLRKAKHALWLAAAVIACLTFVNQQKANKIRWQNEQIVGLKGTVSKQLYRITELQDVLTEAFNVPVGFSTEFEALDVWATAYTATEGETDDTPWETATGALSTVGRLGVSWDLQRMGLRPGATIVVSGMGTSRIDDSTSLYSGKGSANVKEITRTIDILMAHPEAARRWGKRKVTIIWPVQKTKPRGEGSPQGFARENGERSDPKSFSLAAKQ